MSLRNEILNELVTKHSEACNLLVNLVQAIDLEKKEFSCHDEVKAFDLSELDEWTSATIDNLSLSDATPVESDHAFRVMYSLFVDLQSKGINFVSSKSETEIKQSKLKQPCDYLVNWKIDIDADTAQRAAQKAREMLLKPDSEAVVFDVIDRKGRLTTIDLLYDNEESPLGLKRALEELEDDHELKLWEVEIGLFDPGNDPNTPCESHNVYVAAEDQESAVEEARGLAVDNIAVVGRVAFAPCGKPNELDKADFKSFNS